ncbi:hypothetical protein NKH99_15300 [Mesorhizobium sp. M0854]|uniref:hypothetical protein n=1 Tax=Mesorhizobium sp. M0854 TaxID=2957013 RepID=UPI00333C864F
MIFFGRTRVSQVLQQVGNMGSVRLNTGYDFWCFRRLQLDFMRHGCGENRLPSGASAAAARIAQEPG